MKPAGFSLLGPLSSLSLRLECEDAERWCAAREDGFGSAKEVRILPLTALQKCDEDLKDA